jgi:hypothetical protein
MVRHAAGSEDPSRRSIRKLGQVSPSAILRELVLKESVLEAADARSAAGVVATLQAGIPEAVDT